MHKITAEFMGLRYEQREVDTPEEALGAGLAFEESSASNVVIVPDDGLPMSVIEFSRALKAGRSIKCLRGYAATNVQLR